MTIAAVADLYQEYVADGLATPRSIGFALRSTADLVVEANGTVQTLGTHYAVTGTSPNQQIVPLSPFWASGVTIGYYRQTPRAQQYGITAGIDLRAESLEGELDRMQLQQQEQDEDIARTVKVARGEQGIALPATAVRAGKVLRFAEDGAAVTLTLAELAVLLSPEKAAGLTEAYSESYGPRSQVVVFNGTGQIGEGGYPVEFATRDPIDFTRAFARVFSGTGTCDVQVLGNGTLWSKEGVGPVATDEEVELTLAAGFDLVVLITNIVGDVSGVVVKLEGDAA